MRPSGRKARGSGGAAAKRRPLAPVNNAVDKENMPVRAEKTTMSSVTKFGFTPKDASKNAFGDTVKSVQEIHEEHFPPAFNQEASKLLRRKLKENKYDYKKTIDQQKDLIKGLKKNLKETKKKKDAFYQEVSQLHQGLQAQLSDLKKTYKATVLERNSLQSKHRVVKAELDKLKGESHAFELEGAKLSTLQTSLADQKKDLTERLAEVDASYKEASTELREKNAEVARLQTHLESKQRELQSTVDRYKQQIDQLNQSLENSTAQNKAENDAIVMSLKTELASAKAALSESKLKASSCNEQLMQEKMRVGDLQIKIAESNVKIENADKIEARNEAEIKDLKKKLNNTREELNKALGSFSRSQTFHQENLNNANKEKHELQQQITQLQVEKINLTTNLHSTKTQLEELKEAMEVKRTAFNETEKQLSVLQATSAQLQKDIAVSETSLRENVEKVKLVTAELESSKATWAQEKAVLLEAAQKAKGEYERARAEFEKKEVALQKEVQITTQAKEKLEISKTTLQEQVNKLSNDLTKQTCELEAFKKLSGAEKNADIGNMVQMTMELDKLKVQNAAREELRAQLEKAKKQVAQLQDQVFSGEMERRKLHNLVQDLRGNIRVMVRVRPFLDHEKEEADAGTPLDTNSIGEKVHVLSEGKKKSKQNSFSFDKVFNNAMGQKEVFEEVSPLVQSALDGYNVCLFSYGQTGSGKTWTMQGGNKPADQGIIPRSIAKVMETASRLSAQGWSYKMECSFLEIYNESLKDLLTDAENNTVDIKLDKKGVPTVQGLERVEVTNANQIASIMRKAGKARSVAKTEMNARSSRSHAVFTLHLTGQNARKKIAITGALNLCDLAGSERLSRSQASGQQLKETQAINKSLSCLGDVFMSLNKKSSHIPFRNSKLTYLLQPCFGKNGKTLMIVNLSPTMASKHESVCSLRFAQQVNQTEIGRASKQISRMSSSSSSFESSSSSSSTAHSSKGKRGSTTIHTGGASTVIHKRQKVRK